MQIISIIKKTHITGDRSSNHKRYIREQIGDFKYCNCVFRDFFCLSCLHVLWRRYRASLDEMSEFDRGRKVVYRDFRLSFKEIGQRVGRNQATVMRICHPWMQEETRDQRGRLHSPCCTTTRDDRQIVLMTEMNQAVTSRILSQQFVMHHSVSARTI
ncbi:transposable element Tcb1 transposase [Trichonephila clavipes]|nr:transposable element Tcb1 transposase [Trichonephila clavipes]